MLLDQALVAEDGDAGDGVHVLLVQEAYKFRDVVDVDLMLAEQRVLEGNGDAAVGVFNVEDYGVAADFAPVADDAESVVAGGHDAGQVNGAERSEERRVGKEDRSRWAPYPQKQEPG